MGDNDNSTFWDRVLDYLSKVMLPLCLAGVCSGAFFAYGSIQSNKINVEHVQADIQRVSSEHNSRIMANQIGLEKTNEKVHKIEVLCENMYRTLDNIEERMRSNDKKTYSELKNINKTLAVLKDRSERQTDKEIN